VERFLFIVAAVFFAVGFAGCATRPVVVASDEHLVAAQRNADRLAEVSARIGDTLDFASAEVGRIRDLAGSAGGGIADALRLLDAYDEFVFSLIARIAELRDAAAYGTGAEASP